MIQPLRQFVIPLLILAGGGAGFFWLSSRKQPPVRVAAPVPPPLVETGVVEVYPDALPIRVHGVVVPFREVRIAAEVSGRIVEKAERLQAGRFVTAGSPLITIDPEPYQVAIEKLDHEARQTVVDRRRITLEIEQTEKLISLAEQRLALAQRELQRHGKLADMGVQSEAERDVAERTVLEAQTDVAALQNQRDQLPLQLAGLEAKSDVIASQRKQSALDLSRARIVAPLDAIVTQDRHEAGSYVRPGDHLLTLQDPSRFEVAVRLRSDDLFWLHESAEPKSPAGTPGAAFEVPPAAATVTYQAAGELFTWQGRLARGDGSGFDETTRTLACRVVVDQPLRDAESGPPTLIAGMFVDVRIDVTPRRELLAIPRDALQPDGQVWVIEDGQLIVRRVRPVRITDTVVLLRADQAGIRPGEWVATSSLPMAFDGMDVRERAVP